MIFWICIGLVVLALIVGTMHEDFVTGIGAAFVTAILSALVIGITMISSWNGMDGKHTGSETKNLKALGDSSGVSGRYYLGGSYVGSQRVLNFITETNGDIRLDSAKARNSSIREDTEKPHVIIHEWDYHMGWLVPWQLDHQHSYDFHIPKDSVLESYSVDNQ